MHAWVSGLTISLALSETKPPICGAGKPVATPQAPFAGSGYSHPWSRNERAICPGVRSMPKDARSSRVTTSALRTWRSLTTGTKAAGGAGREGIPFSASRSSVAAVSITTEYHHYCHLQPTSDVNPARRPAGYQAIACYTRQTPKPLLHRPPSRSGTAQAVTPANRILTYEPHRVLRRLWCAPCFARSACLILGCCCGVADFVLDWCGHGE